MSNLLGLFQKRKPRLVGELVVESTEIVGGLAVTLTAPVESVEASVGLGTQALAAAISATARVSFAKTGLSNKEWQILLDVDPVTNGQFINSNGSTFPTGRLCQLGFSSSAPYPRLPPNAEGVPSHAVQPTGPRVTGSTVALADVIEV